MVHEMYVGSTLDPSRMPIVSTRMENLHVEVRGSQPFNLYLTLLQGRE